VYILLIQQGINCTIFHVICYILRKTLELKQVFTLTTEKHFHKQQAELQKYCRYQWIITRSFAKRTSQIHAVENSLPGPRENSVFRFQSQGFYKNNNEFPATHIGLAGWVHKVKLYRLQIQQGAMLTEQPQKDCERTRNNYRAFKNVADGVLPMAPKPTPTAKPSTHATWCTITCINYLIIIKIIIIITII